jgi:outer membrane protein assembly factor BamA
MRALPLLLAVALLLTAEGLRAQSYSLRLHRLDGDTAELLQLLRPPKSFPEQAAAFSFVRQIVPQLQEAGYLAASADSVAVIAEGYEVYIFLGKKWRWARLSLAKVPLPVLAGTGITEAQYTGRPLSPGSLARLTERMLRWCEDNGYPFARVGLDSVASTEDGGVRAQLAVETGALRRLDSLIIDGDVRISKAFLSRYLGLQEGDLYNESQISRITARLRDLPYLEAGATWRIAFRSTDTKLHISMKERRANQLTAIIGLQPNTAATGKFLLTADVQAAFQNLLASGESFSFSYQKLQAASPRIKAEATYPYLFGTPLGAEGHFDLYFKGQEYRRTMFDIGGRYGITSLDFLRIYYRSYSNRIIAPDTAYILAYHRLPDNIDVTSGGGGTEAQLIHTDYRFNPTRGWALRINGEMLHRTVQKNDGITGIRDASGFDYTTLYDTLPAPTYQYQLSGDAAWYIRLAKRVVLKNAWAGGWISGERLFRNELFQIGGFRLLRGFDEGSLFANQYHILTTELRFILGRASNVYLFADNAWLQSKVNGLTQEGIYNGFGMGALLDTRTGQLTIAYGLGRGPGSPVQLRQSRIHIGYIAYF